MNTPRLLVLGAALLPGFALSAAAATPATCTVSDGAVNGKKVTFAIPTAGGVVVKETRKSCVALVGGNDPVRAALVVTILAIHDKDAGPEQLLNIEPDGARRWLLEKVKDAKPLGQGKVTIEGKAWPWYRFNGTPPGQRAARSMLITRAKRPGHNLVFIAMYQDANRQDQALKLIGGTTAKVGD